MHKKRRLCALAWMFCAVAVLFAGGSRESEEPQEIDREVNPYGVYDPPVTITTPMRSFGNEQIPTEESLFFREFEKYGIDVEIAWSADASQYDSKINLAIASGDIPDLMFVGAGQQLTSLVEGDLVADIGDYFHYLNEANQRYLTEGVGAEAVRSVTFDGEVKMIPTNVTTLQNNSFPLFLRKDWLENLGLDAPETMEEFREVALAFTHDDPDGNGRDDTYGLTIMGKTNLIVDWGGLFGFFPGFGIQPLTWYDGMLFYSLDEEGNAVWDGKDPRVKDGLQLLADLYAEGAIPADFPTMDGPRVQEDLTSGVAGMVFGVRGLPVWAFDNAQVVNPEADWICVDMPTVDPEDETPLFAFQPVNVGYVVSRECEHPEAIIKLANIHQRVTDPNSPDVDPRFNGDIEVQGPIVVEISNPRKEMEETLGFFEAIEARDITLCPPNLTERYGWVIDYMDNGTPENWKWWNAFAPLPGHSWYYTFVETDPSVIRRNAYWHLPSARMNATLPIFKKMAEETITKIIMGSEPVSAWDTMVENWDRLGGREMTAEVQASLQP